MPNPNITLAHLDVMDLKVFDPAEYITSDEAAVAYINEALAENDAALLASALGDVARGMTEVAKNAGIARESLYKALRQNSQPRMETISKVLAALGLRLMVEPVVEQTTALAKKKSKPKAPAAKV